MRFLSDDFPGLPGCLLSVAQIERCKCFLLAGLYDALSDQFQRCSEGTGQCRRTPGRPVTYGTTDRFLDQFSLEDIRDLPGMEDLKGAGLLSSRMPAGFAVPVPPADPDLLDPDEDPPTDNDLQELGLLTPPRPDD